MTTNPGGPRMTRRGWVVVAALGALSAYVLWVYVFRWYVAGVVWLRFHS